MGEMISMVGIARRLRNAQHEIATALVEAEQAGVPVRFCDRIATAAYKTGQVAHKIAALKEQP